MGIRKAVAKGSMSGTVQIIQKYPLAASQDISAGELLIDNGSGKAVVATAGVATDLVLGFATAPAVSGGSVGADDVVSYDANPMTTYEVAYEGSTKTSLDNEDIGKKFDLGSNAYTIDLDDTTGGYLQVVDFNNDKGTATVFIRQQESIEN